MHSNFTRIWNTFVGFFPKATVPNTTLKPVYIFVFSHFFNIQIGKVIRCEFLQLHSLFPQLFTLSPNPLFKQMSFWFFPKRIFPVCKTWNHKTKACFLHRFLPPANKFKINLFLYSTSSLFVKNIQVGFHLPLRLLLPETTKVICLDLYWPCYETSFHAIFKLFMC